MIVKDKSILFINEIYIFGKNKIEIVDKVCIYLGIFLPKIVANIA